MNTSNQPLPARADESNRIQPFRYRTAAPSSAGSSAKFPGARVAMHEPVSGYGEGLLAPDDQESHQRQLDEAYRRGLDEGRAELAVQLESLRDAVATTLREFAKERETYFENVERRVVELALAIARKILHRESQTDPLVLAGVARVALESISSATFAKLRVNPARVFSWSDFFSRQAGLSPHPEVVGDAEMGLDQCVLESNLGSVDLGLEKQLVEIERGFLDLIALKP